MRAFIIDENGNIDFADSLKALPQVRTMLTLNYNKGKGDVDGRNRGRYEREKNYLFYMYSFQSPYNEDTAERRLNKSLGLAGLPESFKESELLESLAKEIDTIQKLSYEWKALCRARVHLERLDDMISTTEDPDIIIKFMEKLPKLNETMAIAEKAFKDALKDKIVAVGGEEISEWES